VAFGNSFNEEDRVVAAAYDNGDVKLLDLRMNAIRWETNVLNGVVDLEFDRKDIEMNKLLVTTLEQRFRVFDTRTQHPTEGFACLTEKAHKSTVWVGRHLPQNRTVFVTCGGNGSVGLWKYNYPTSRVKKDEQGVEMGVVGTLTAVNEKPIAAQPIVSWDWHTDKTGLACLCALDQTVKVAIVTKLNQL
jgi:WD40 repeat protein